MSKSNQQLTTFSSKKAFKYYIEEKGVNYEVFKEKYPRHQRAAKPSKVYWSKLQREDIPTLTTCEKCAEMFGITLKQFIEKGWV